MADWIIPCNPEYYDIVGSFEKLDSVDWRQSTTGIMPGDISMTLKRHAPNRAKACFLSSQVAKRTESVLWKGKRASRCSTLQIGANQICRLINKMIKSFS